MTDETLEHYGIIRRSGRYPWGSGGNTKKQSLELYEVMGNMLRDGIPERSIADFFNMTVKKLRGHAPLGRAALKETERLNIIKMSNDLSPKQTALELGITERRVKSVLKSDKETSWQRVTNVADSLVLSLERNPYIDVGSGTELHLGVRKPRLKSALQMLKTRGYEIHYLREEQLDTGHLTSFKVLTKGGVDWRTVRENRDKVRPPGIYSEDNGKSFTIMDKVTSINPNRIKVVSGPEGGSDKDGLMELRRTPELDLGASSYAQVRIAVGDSHYLKGMAVHKNNMPDGVDIVFYTNKPKSNDVLSSLKPQETTGENPFGAVVRQKKYIDPLDGKEKLSALNIVNEEGNWSKWDRNLASQFLSKQPPTLAKKQLEQTFKNTEAELAEIMTITHPQVRKHMLLEFADGADASSVHLKGAALPRQTVNVLIPSSTIKSDEVYAPNYRNGEVLALVRYPHGGVFEIPIVRVNNKNKEMSSLLKGAKDAIGIHPDVAAKMSGADFDGDTAVTIPIKRLKLKSTDSLAGLRNFSPTEAYPGYEGMPEMKGRTQQIKMGDVSNLITDMTIFGASPDELARAVRHSMVVIDAKKHGLNYQQSYKDNAIGALKKKYQGSARSGASTLISKAKSEERVLQRKPDYIINPKTGVKEWVNTGKFYINEVGERVDLKTKSTKLAEKRDARDLSSGTVIENVYANHSNRMKSLANQARLSYLDTKSIPYSAKDAKVYKKQVDSLKRKLDRAVRNQPLERTAQLVAGHMYRQKLKAHPDMTPEDKRSAKGKSLMTARKRVGAKKTPIDISPEEWKAITAGAISPTRLDQILRHTKPEVVRNYATPRTRIGLSTIKSNRARQLLDAGYTPADVADALGVPTSQITNLD